MKICFVGIGSIAKRHIRNLDNLLCKKNINYQIDALRSNSNAGRVDLPPQITDVYYSPDDVPSDYDVIFITNPTEYHAGTLQLLHNKAKHFFIEKPVASLSTIDTLNTLSYRNDSIYYVACPLRYNSVIQYIKTHLDISTVNSVRSISSSYLPDWRPGIDYRNTYSAHKHLGGGVSIDLIHEWDYLTYIYGMPTDVKSFKGKVSNLDIDSDDFAIYIAKYDSMTVELHLDYYGRQNIRKMEIFTNDDTIIADLLNGTITYQRLGKLIELPEDRDAFQARELNFFLDLIEGKHAIGNDIDNSIKVLQLTQGVLRK